MIHPAPKPAPKVRQPKPLKRSRMKKRAKSAATYAQQYLSAEFVAFVQARPCAVCGVRGFSVAAHTKGIEKKGAGQKTSWRTLAPLCGVRPYAVNLRPGLYPGCHHEYDNDARIREEYAATIGAAIKSLHADWQAHSRTGLEQQVAKE